MPRRSAFGDGPSSAADPLTGAGEHVPEPALEFGILGPLTVHGPHGPIAIAGARRRALLIRLVSAGGKPVPSDRLAEELWDGVPPPGAASTLRSHLSLLRKVVGPERLRSRHGNVALDLAGTELDAARFASECDQARRALVQRDPLVADELFRRALSRWRGPALIDVVGSAWSVPEARRLEELRLIAIEGSLGARMWLGHHLEVVAEAEAAVGEYPLREQLWAVLMSALYRSGRQTDALRAYQRLRAHLVEELGIEPSPVTRALEQAILVQEASLDMPVGPDAGTDRPSQPRTSRHKDGPPVAGQPTDHRAAGITEGPGMRAAGSDLTWLPLPGAPMFVGRDIELGTAERARARVQSGRQVLLVITGEPGIGKTRLAAELALASARAGDLVLYGRWDKEELSAFKGFRQAIGGFIRHPMGRTVLEELGPLVGPLGHVVPEARDHLDSAAAPTSTQAEAEAERYHSFEAVVALVRAASRRRPLLLVLEDLQWADTPSITLLEHLLRAPMGAPVLVVATYRDTEPVGPDWLSEGLVGLRRAVEVERIDLCGLSAPMSLALLQSAIGPTIAVDGSHEASLHEYTGGNPFFLQEIALDILAGRDALTPPVDLVASHRPAISDRLREVVHWRLSRLSDACMRVLSIATMMGIEFTAGIVAVAADCDESSLLAVLDEARASGVITEIPDRPDAYRFPHDLVRQTLYADLGGSRRIRLHLRIARALEDRHGNDPSRAAELALHYRLGAAAGSADRAVHYLRYAGEVAMSHIAQESAVDLFDAALEVSATYFPADHEGRCELLLLLADAMVKSGQLVGGDQRFTEAFELGEKLDRNDLMVSAALGVGGVLPVGVEPNATAQELLRTALTKLGSGDRRLRALALGRLAQWGHFVDDRDDRRRSADEAVALARQLGDPATLASCLEYRLWALIGPDDMDSQVRSARGISSIGRHLGDPELMLRGMKCELHVEFERGDFAAADRLAQSMRGLAERIEQPEYLRLVYMWDSLVAGVQGRFDDAEANAEKAFAIFRRSGHSQADAIAVGLSLTWMWLQGRLAEFEPILVAGQTGRSSLGELALSAWVASEVGRPEFARSVLADLHPEAVAAHDRNFHWWFAIVGLSHAACNLEDREWASFLYELISPYASHNCRVGQATFLGSASFYLGRLSSAARRPDVAIPHLQAALAHHESMGADPFIELTKRSLASAMSDRGDTGDGNQARQVGR